MTRPLSVYAWGISLLLHAVLWFGLWAWCGLLPGLLLTLPLAAAVPGLLRRDRRTAGWLTMLLVFYIGGLMWEAFSIPSRRSEALGFSVVGLAEFTALVLFVRLFSREQPSA